MEPPRNTAGKQTRIFPRTLQTRRPKPPPGRRCGAGARRARWALSWGSREPPGAARRQSRAATVSGHERERLGDGATPQPGLSAAPQTLRGVPHREGGSAHRDAALRPASEAASAPLSSSCSFLRRLFLAHPLGSIQLCPLFLRGSPPFPTPLPSVVGSARRRLGDWACPNALGSGRRAGAALARRVRRAGRRARGRGPCEGGACRRRQVSCSQSGAGGRGRAGGGDREGRPGLPRPPPWGVVRGGPCSPLGSATSPTLSSLSLTERTSLFGPTRGSGEASDAVSEELRRWGDPGGRGEAGGAQGERAGSCGCP